MFRFKVLEHVVIGGFQRVKSGHMPNFRKTSPVRPDMGRKRGHVRGKPGRMVTLVTRQR